MCVERHKTKRGHFNMKNLGFEQIVPQILGNSQKGQDSFIQHAFNIFGTTNKYYVEFGAEDGYYLSNTSYLREKKGWSGLLIEGKMGPEIPEINLRRRFILKDNICDLFKEFEVPIEHDFLCVDLDGNDYWIMKSILEGGYKPRVIMCENNVRFQPYESMVMKYNPNWYWDAVKWYGGSPYAFKKLFNQHDYIPVWIHIDDMIVVRKDVLIEFGYEEPDWNYVYPKANAKIYEEHRRGDYFVHEPDWSTWETV